MTVLAIGGCATVLTAGAAAPAAIAAVGSTGGLAAGAGTIAAATTGAAAGAGTVGTTVLVPAVVATGPIGWLTLGGSYDEQTQANTFDCWKPVLRDESFEPSNGKLLKDVVADPRIKDVVIKSSSSDTLPEIILHNIWDEEFIIEYVTLPSAQTALHAVRLN